MESIEAHPNTGLTLQFPSAVNSRVGRRLPSEGKGHTFESCRVRQIFFYSAICAPGLELWQGVVHVFPANVALLRAAREALDNIGEFLRRNLGS